MEIKTYYYACIIFKDKKKAMIKKRCESRDEARAVLAELQKEYEDEFEQAWTE